MAYEKAVKWARALGLSYKPVMELAQGEAQEIIKRADILDRTKLVAKRQAVSAVLGGIAKPTLKLSQMLNRYCEYA